METKQITNKTITKIYQDSDFSEVREKYQDPGTKYAFSVLDGKTQAGYMMQLACLRHLRDLRHQGKPDFPYNYDLAEAGKVLKFAKICPNETRDNLQRLCRGKSFCLANLLGGAMKRVASASHRSLFLSVVVKGKHTYKLFLCVSLISLKASDYLTKIIW